MKKALILLALSHSLFASGLKITPKEFTLTSYETKKEVSYKDFVGKKGIVLNFWASWCTSCIAELPELKALKSLPKYKGYKFFGISAGDKKKQIKKFVRRHGFPYPILMDKDKKVSKSWGVYSLPVTVIIDKNGKIEYKGVRPPKH